MFPNTNNQEDYLSLREINFEIWALFLNFHDLKGQKSRLTIAQNHLQVSDTKFYEDRLKLIYFLTSNLTTLTSEVKGHDVNLFETIIRSHIPIFVKIGSP